PRGPDGAAEAPPALGGGLARAGRGPAPRSPVGAGTAGRVPRGDPRRRPRRHLARARRALLIRRRRRHCAAPASSTNGERVGVSGLLGRSLLLLLLARGQGDRLSRLG